MKTEIAKLREEIVQLRERVAVLEATKTTLPWPTYVPPDPYSWQPFPVVTC